MTYTVGETAKILNLAPSTLRYYDKEGLLPFVKRSNGGIRVFHDSDFEWLFLIECLKKSGLSIKDIKAYLDMTQKGDETISERLDMLKKQREKVLMQIQSLTDTLDVLNYKCWYYETAQKYGTTAVPRNMPTEEIPQEYKKAKENLSKMQQK